MFQPCPSAWRDRTHLSRFRARGFPWLFCKTVFAASMPRARFQGRRRCLCAVNVKLTMRFRIAAGLLWSAHSISRGSQVPRRDCYTGGVKQIWSSRGEGWGCRPGGPCAKGQHRRGRAFSEPSLIDSIDVLAKWWAILPVLTRRGQPFKERAGRPDRGIGGPIRGTRGRQVSGAVETPIRWLRGLVQMQPTRERQTRRAGCL